MRTLTAFCAIAVILTVSIAPVLATDMFSRTREQAPAWILKHAPAPVAEAPRLGVSAPKVFGLTDRTPSTFLPQRVPAISLAAPVNDFKPVEVPREVVVQQPLPQFQPRSINGMIVPVPEPSGLVALAGPLLAGFGYWRKRR